MKKLKEFKLPELPNGEIYVLSQAALPHPQFESDVSAQLVNITKIHDSGWTVTGTVSADYYAWVKEFVATHPVHGTVAANDEGNCSLYISSQKALKHFLKCHPLEIFDLHDI